MKSYDINLTWHCLESDILKLLTELSTQLKVIATIGKKKIFIKNLS